MEYALRTNNLIKCYKSFAALDGLNINVPFGSVYGFVGKNGTGKTNLIRVICGLQKQTSGSFSVYGTESVSGEISRARRRMGAVIESPSFYPSMTAEDNLKQQYCILGRPSYKGISELLYLVGLENTKSKKAGNFSLGMRQRLGIAIALAGSPDFLILDGATNGLDPQALSTTGALY